MRTVRSAGRPIHQEGLVRRDRALLPHPGHGLVGHVCGEVVALFVRRRQTYRVLHHGRFVLRRFAGQETVEIVEAYQSSRWPKIEWSLRCDVFGRRVVPLAEGRRLVSVIAQHLGNRRGSRRHAARCSHPSRLPVRQSDQSRIDVGCARLARRRGSASTSPRCGSCCRRCRSLRPSTASACGPAHHRCRGLPDLRRRA